MRILIVQPPENWPPFDGPIHTSDIKCHRFNLKCVCFSHNRFNFLSSHHGLEKIDSCKKLIFICPIVIVRLVFVIPWGKVFWGNFTFCQSQMSISPPLSSTWVKSPPKVTAFNVYFPWVSPPTLGLNIDRCIRKFWACGVVSMDNGLPNYRIDGRTTDYV